MTPRSAGPWVWVVSWLLATIAGGAGALPVVTLALALPAVVVLPSAAVIAGLLAGVVAAAVRNRFAVDDSRADLRRVLVVAVVAALLVLGLSGVVQALFDPAPVIGYVVGCAVVIGAVATWAARRFRVRPGSRS